ncbi:MAG: hypothetical protein KF771_04375 [Burkholderiales bacterium]|nr:hypothetical protein [Burkholderiales bacterium]
MRVMGKHGRSPVRAKLSQGKGLFRFSTVVVDKPVRKMSKTGLSGLRASVLSDCPFVKLLKKYQ